MLSESGENGFKITNYAVNRVYRASSSVTGGYILYQFRSISSSTSSSLQQFLYTSHIWSKSINYDSLNESPTLLFKLEDLSWSDYFYVHKSLEIAENIIRKR